MITVSSFLEGLTKKQLDVLSCLIFGLSYKSIGRTLQISDRTVGVHVCEILKKSAVHSKDELVKQMNLAKNAYYYEELRKRYQLIVSGNSIQKNTIPWTKCITIGALLLLSGITAYHYLSKTEISLQSIGNSTYLLEREGLIKQMVSRSGTIILKGQGGAGKTTIAREYLKNINTAVKYEINTENKGSIKSEISGLARALSKTTKDIENKNIIDNISGEQERLRHLSIFLFDMLKKEKNWCLLLDNLDTPNLLPLMYLDNLLHLKNGTIVITTRNKDIDNYFPEAKIISVGKLNDEEKKKLFCKITKQLPSKVIEENLKKIPSYPLDVSCCAHYVKNTGISLPVYIQQMERMDNVFWEGNQKILSENANYNKSRYSIVTSSIENILQQNQAIIEFLFVISILDSQKIPLNLLLKITGDQLAYESVHNFRKYGLLEINPDNTFSLHRTAQLIMRQYCLQHISQKNLLKFISQTSNVICNEKDNAELIPHMKAILSNLKDLLPLSYKIEIKKSLIKLIQNYGCPPVSATKYIREIIKTGASVLPQNEILDLKLDGIKLCILAGKNQEAREFIDNKDFERTNFRQEHLLTHINYYMLTGILYMRNRFYKEANDNFDQALKLMGRIDKNSDKHKMLEAMLYSEKGLNYFLFHINKPQMYQAVQMMKHSIELISDLKTQDAINILANTKIWLASIYNSLRDYDKALQMCHETEYLLNKIEIKNNNYYNLQGSVYVEKGHNALRANNLEEAERCLRKAKNIFNKLAMYDNFYRVRMQETETLVRLKKYKEAYQDCIEVINEGKTDNDFNELFLNTAHYNSAVIQYKLRNNSLALKHFRDFSVKMRDFCRHFLSQKQYKELQDINAFDTTPEEKNIKIYFQHALEIFKRVCVSGSEFVTDYVQKNFEECE